MKTKAFFLLSIACFLMSLGFLLGQLVSTNIEAVDYGQKIVLPTMSVVFDDDFMREHGKQLFHFSEKLNINEWTHLITIPENKRFVLEKIYLLWDFTLSTTPDDSGYKYGWEGGVLPLVIEPGESIYIKRKDTGTFPIRVSFNGYYVGLEG